MSKKTKYILATVIGIVLSIITHIIPMYLSVPKYIYLNIAGTVLIGIVFGPLAGGIYAGLLHIVLNNIGMGMGPQISVLISHAIQGFLLVFSLSKFKSTFKIVTIPIFMALISQPINIIIFSILNNNLLEKLRNLPTDYLYFLNNNLLDSVLMYFVSIVLATIIIKILHIKEGFVYE